MACFALDRVPIHVPLQLRLSEGQSCTQVVFHGRQLLVLDIYFHHFCLFRFGEVLAEDIVPVLDVFEAQQQYPKPAWTVAAAVILLL